MNKEKYRNKRTFSRKNSSLEALSTCNFTTTWVARASLVYEHRYASAEREPQLHTRNETSASPATHLVLIFHLHFGQKGLGNQPATSPGMKRQGVLWDLMHTQMSGFKKIRSYVKDLLPMNLPRASKPPAAPTSLQQLNYFAKNFVFGNCYFVAAVSTKMWNRHRLEKVQSSVLIPAFFGGGRQQSWRCSPQWGHNILHSAQTGRCNSGFTGSLLLYKETVFIRPPKSLKISALRVSQLTASTMSTLN